MRVSARGSLLATLLAALLVALLVPATAHRRLDQDFEFDDAPEASITHARRPRRYVYDPENPMCRALVCKKREVCLLRDAFTALCATKKDILRRGDQIVSDVSSDDEDVFYESHEHAAGSAGSTGGARCVGCGGAARAAFLCGSDNRTYSSLCRLDLHNCVHRAAPPVRLACRGFCPCAPRGQRPRRPERPQRVRAHRTRTPYDEDRRRRRLDAHNEVFERPFRRPSQDMEGCALDKMANRLLDWFSVLMDEAGGIPPPQEGFPSGCKPEVRWMFSHLDSGGDGLLSTADLYALRHDERERCLRPFLSSCASGGAGGGLSRSAWCGCLARAARPCAALARAHPAPPPGAYVPACDARGWYRPRQCHTALGVCWCVDAHGVERAGSRTKGKPQCPAGESDIENDLGVEESSEAEGESETESHVGREGVGRGAPDDDEDAGGSGDRNNELRF